MSENVAPSNHGFVNEGGAEKRKLVDQLLPVLDDDPRSDRSKKGKVQKKFKGGGRNSESFDPKSTLVRPEMRIVVGPNRPVYNKQLKHDDVVVVPEFFCSEDDWSLYYKLVEEMRAEQAEGVKKSEWVSWHEGAHLISHNPAGSRTFQMIQDKISAYFGITQKSVGTRFNWYRDAKDWKPFHHDSAAFNPQRARNQNITVGVSFGATRELAFLNAKNGTKVYFPQTNGMLFSFGRDVNIHWKHGVNAITEVEQEIEGRGRISIILWGMCNGVVEEEGSPPMLTDNSRGNGYNMHRPPNQRHQGQHGGGGVRRDDRDERGGGRGGGGRRGGGGGGAGRGGGGRGGGGGEMTDGTRGMEGTGIGTGTGVAEGRGKGEIGEMTEIGTAVMAEMVEEEGMGGGGYGRGGGTLDTARSSGGGGGG